MAVFLQRLDNVFHFRVDIDRNDCCPFIGKPEHRRLANTGSRGGNDGNLAGISLHDALPELANAGDGGR